MATLAIHGGDPVRTRPFGGWPESGREEEELLLEALRSGHWGSLDGTFVNRLEVDFAELQAARHGVSCVNATMGLAVALRALDIGVGDEVIVPPYTFIATASAALMLGAIPVFVDVDPETLLIDPAGIDAAVTSPDPGHHSGPSRRFAGRHGWGHGRGRGATACGSSRMRHRRTARRGAAGRSEPSATSACSASSRPSRSTPARAG